VVTVLIISGGIAAGMSYTTAVSVRPAGYLSVTTLFCPYKLCSPCRRLSPPTGDKYRSLKTSRNASIWPQMPANTGILPRGTRLRKISIR
jgi:hypothetical protein